MSSIDARLNLYLSYFYGTQAPDGTCWNCHVDRMSESFIFKMFTWHFGTSMHVYRFTVQGSDIRSPEVRVQVMENMIQHYKTQPLSDEAKLHFYQWVIEYCFKRLE
jgi:hypothetical protein